MSFPPYRQRRIKSSSNASLLRLLAQMEHVMAINGLEVLSANVVETARTNLVIGHA